ncbi:MAG: BAX inhibitor protein [Chromatiales bacterium]|jgi:modulator of FtsH protease|nr:BAX inhibitor protein [Chromatiales bacterium]MDP6151705.1 Bax inhibitor-1/YccA family protein [Gammaproteobacteria bacterium]MDP7094120.1 Bax inhibitor-1/YccA family protein [Gammaproteobacteria bacterium]HJP03620.1 Bax inhibitor-1/YccA family protein [Gammaproteobacteria bacterium]
MQQDPVRRDGTRVVYGEPIRESALQTNKVLRSTYMLLSVTLLFSAAMAGVSMALKLPYFGPLLTIGGMFGLLFLTHALRNSAGGIIAVFAFTGFMGLVLGPTLTMYMENVPNGGELILTSLGATGLIFLSLSAYVLKTGKDFSFLGGFLTVGLIGIVIVMLLGWFVFDFSAYQMTISSAVVLLMGGFILFDTSRIIHGGQTNYISATVSLYLSIYNIFIHLLMLLGGNRE